MTMITWWGRSTPLQINEAALSATEHELSKQQLLGNPNADVASAQKCHAVLSHKARGRLLIKAILTIGLLAFGAQNLGKNNLAFCHSCTDVLSYILEDNPEPVLRPLPNCPPLNYIESAWFEFDDLINFEFLELLKPNSIPPTHVGGKVSVIDGPANQKAQIRALVLFGSSDQHMVRNVAIQKMASSLIVDPTYGEVDDQSFPKLCLTLDVYILMKPKTKLDTFTVNVTNLNIDIRRGFTMVASNHTTMSAKSGNVACAEATTFVSRETRIDVHSGSVTGIWALFDLLSVHTQSGSISIDVQPKAALDSKPVPAVFEAKAQSGNVAIRFSVSGDIPNRDYRTDVFSQSGAVSGSYIHGRRTSLISRSGSLRADILPVDGVANNTMLMTESYSGFTSINVMQPFLGPGNATNNLQSRHQTQSGSLTLRYPAGWQGTIDGSVVSGSLAIHGKDVKIIKDEKFGSTRHMVAEKGKGDSYIQFGSTSGSAVVSFW